MERDLGIKGTWWAPPELPLENLRVKDKSCGIRYFRGVDRDGGKCGKPVSSDNSHPVENSVCRSW